MKTNENFDIEKHMELKKLADKLIFKDKVNATDVATKFGEVSFKASEGIITYDDALEQLKLLEPVEG